MSKLFRVIIMFESKTARPNIVHLVSFLVKTDKIFGVANEVSQVSVSCRETKVHPKVRNHGEGPYQALLLVESGYFRFDI